MISAAVISPSVRVWLPVLRQIRIHHHRRFVKCEPLPSRSRNLGSMVGLLRGGRACGGIRAGPVADLVKLGEDARREMGVGVLLHPRGPNDPEYPPCGAFSAEAL